MLTSRKAGVFAGIRNVFVTWGIVMARKFFSVALVVSLVAAVWFGARLWGAQDEQEEARRDYMRAKLNYTQAILEGLSTQDYDLIIRGADEVKRITEGALWAAIDSDDYRRMSDQLRESADRLRTMAEDKNLEGSALRFFDMTLSCIDCHKHITGKSF